MRPSDDLRKLGQLVAIRHAERETSRADVHMSRHSFDRATEIEKNITQQRDAAMVRWTDFLSSTHFLPELSRGLAAAILNNEVQLEQAGKITGTAAQRVALAEAACRMADLHYDLATDLTRQASRHHRKCRKERELTENTDLFGIRGKRYGN